MQHLATARARDPAVADGGGLDDRGEATANGRRPGRAPNRISASRLQRTAEILQVSVPFFFEDLPDGVGAPGATPPPSYVSDFLATTDGLNLIKAFMRIQSAKLRRSIVNLVEAITGAEQNDGVAT
jgi:hypothetical protein